MRYHTIGNPEGFRTDHGLEADTIEIAIGPASIAQDLIVLHKMLIDAPHIIHETGKSGSNLDANQHSGEAHLGTGGEKGSVKRAGATANLIIRSRCLQQMIQLHRDSNTFAVWAQWLRQPCSLHLAILPGLPTVVRWQSLWH